MTTNSQDRVERLRGSAASPMRKPGLWILYSATLLKPGNFRHPSCAGFTCILVFLNILRYCLVLYLLRYHCLVIASSSCSVRVSDV